MRSRHGLHDWHIELRRLAGGDGDIGIDSRHSTGKVTFTLTRAGSSKVRILRRTFFMEHLAISAHISSSVAVSYPVVRCANLGGQPAQPDVCGPQHRPEHGPQVQEAAGIPLPGRHLP
jgi:hypothetical protein